jgi:hypothetical protein
MALMLGHEWQHIHISRSLYVRSISCDCKKLNRDAQHDPTYTNVRKYIAPFTPSDFYYLLHARLPTYTAPHSAAAFPTNKQSSVKIQCTYNIAGLHTYMHIIVSLYIWIC